MSVLEPAASVPASWETRYDGHAGTTRAGAEPKRSSRRLGFVTLAVVAVMLALQIVLIVHGLDGHFSYTLDDPYIHLALADQIARGHYGLDPMVAAAPSSSILYPFLLAALSFTGIGQFAPLLVNSVATLASGLLLSLLFAEIFPAARLRLAPMLVLASALLLGLNLIGLALTGMEHALHVAVTLAWALGALRFLRSGRVAGWWWMCALAEPLIRYEGAALWLATVILLLCHRRIREGLALFLAGAALLGAFSAFLHGLGLPLLPSSILVKTNQTGASVLFPDVGPIGHVFYTVATNLTAPNAGLLAASTLLLVLLFERKRRSRDPWDRRLLQLTAIAIAVGGAQFAFGRVDAFSRYEIYVLALHGAVLAAGFAGEIERFARHAGVLPWAGILLALALPFSDYVERSLRADLAARNIYEQQYQMHRMATEFYRGPVAVNDLGWVTYGNPYPVLDLWGLGSEEARKARAADPTGRWMADLVARHRVGLAMIYDAWFPNRPRSWLPLARLTLGSRLASAADPTVTFYATAPEHVAPIQAALDGLAAGLPSDARIERVAP